VLDLKGIENVQLVIWFVVPGLVALYARAQFLTGRMPAQADAILPCLSLSLVCVAIGQPIQQYLLPSQQSQWYLAGTLVVLFVVPVALGALLGLSAQRGWGKRLLHKLKMNVIHQVPCAWDWKFADCTNGAWLLIVLKDGTKYGGLFGTQSFASSDGKERDLYIERVYDIGDDNVWRPLGQGALIVASEIRTVEFWPIQSEESSNERQDTSPNHNAPAEGASTGNN
jgi:hypothetical protein